MTKSEALKRIKNLGFTPTACYGTRYECEDFAGLEIGFGEQKIFFVVDDACTTCLPLEGLEIEEDFENEEEEGRGTLVFRMKFNGQTIASFAY